MAISPIGYQPNFTAKAKTEKGNEYEKCNTGKLVGGGTGVLLGGINLYRGQKMYDNTMKEIGKTFDEVATELPGSKVFLDTLKEGLDPKKNPYLKEGYKIGKVAALFGGILGMAILTGIGVVAGKLLYDNKQNEKRAEAADKTAESLATK